jgi:site-specific DNA-methyltransferase (adenine-specific)
VFEPWQKDEYVAMKKQKVHLDDEGREWIWGHQGRGKSHAYRIYLDEQVRRGRAIDSVWDIPIINTSAKERVGYPTQKPMALMTRVVELTTAPGDWVADFAGGSGTTGVAARALGRRCWIGDANPAAVEMMAVRLGLSLNHNTML